MSLRMNKLNVPSGKCILRIQVWFFFYFLVNNKINWDRIKTFSYSTIKNIIFYHDLLKKEICMFPAVVTFVT